MNTNEPHHNYSQNACVPLEDLTATNCHVAYKSFAAIIFDFHVNRFGSQHDVQTCYVSVVCSLCCVEASDSLIERSKHCRPSIYPVMLSSIYPTNTEWSRDPCSIIPLCVCRKRNKHFPNVHHSFKAFHTSVSMCLFQFVHIPCAGEIFAHIPQVYEFPRL